MSEPLQKDQIVACWDRDDCDKAIRIYIGKEGMVHRCRLPGFEHGDPDFELWECCVPLEEVEPGAFIGRERYAREQDRAVEMESKLVKRLRRQIRWLCRSLAERTHVALDCPQDMDCSFIEADCSRCWEEASFKATKEEHHA